MRTFKFFASCPKETEKYLVREIEAFNPKGVKIAPGGVLFKGVKSLAIDVLLNSRISSRIYRHLVEFKITEAKELYHQARLFKWYEEFSCGQTFKIKTIFDKDSKSKFKNSLYMGQLLKDAIVDEFVNNGEKRPDVELKDPDIDLLARIERVSKSDYKVQIWMDLIGTPLDKRGYRKAGFTAPLRENLAAAIIYASQWGQEKKQKILDPMCGTGTLLVEAAMIKYHLPPTFLRVRDAIEKRQQVFSLERQFWFNEDDQITDYFDRAMETIYNQTLETLNNPPPEILIFGSDVEKKALRMTSDTIKRCFLEKFIHVTIQNAKTVRPPPSSGKQCTVVCNPPYGERLSDIEKLRPFYHDFGENLKEHFKGSSAFIFTGNSELRKSISLQTSQRVPFYNGNIECRLLKYDLF